MAFQSVNNQTPKQRKMLIGVIKEKTSTGSLYLKIEEDVDIILYKDGEYFKLKMSQVNVVNDGKAVFALEVNLDSPNQVEFKTRD